MFSAPFFAGARPQSLETLSHSALVRTAESGQALFHEGDAAARFIVIAAGDVRVWRSSPDGATVTVHMLGPGDIPGCVAVFRGIPYPATATAASEVRTLSWPLDQITALVRDDPALARNALDIVGARNAEMLQRLLEVSTLGVETRLARALLRLADAVPPGTGDDAMVVPLSRQSLAELTATTLHTVSRFISRWESEGILSGGRGRVTVRNRAALAALAQED